MKLSFNLGQQGFDIVLKRGTLGKVSALTGLGGKVLLVHDSGTPQRYVKTLAAQCAQPVCIQLPAGPAAKTPAAWQLLVQRMLAEGFGRGDVVAALGGGRVADTAGFAAATYLRGVALKLFPTTLTAQLACIEGRPSLDLDDRPDVLGAGCAPAFVGIDPDLLASLPPAQQAAGYTEALKVALMADSELLAILESDIGRADVERVICLTLLRKMELIRHDESWLGQARLLLFGQALGQAICAAAGAEAPPYGACVGLGMLPLIESRSLARRTKTLMAKLGLPVLCPVSPGSLLDHISPAALQDDGSYALPRVKTAGQGYLDTVSRAELELLLNDAGARTTTSNVK